MTNLLFRKCVPTSPEIDDPKYTARLRVSNLAVNCRDMPTNGIADGIQGVEQVMPGCAPRTRPL
jgi:hypothetical protein